MKPIVYCILVSVIAAMCEISQAFKGPAAPFNIMGRVSTMSRASRSRQNTVLNMAYGGSKAEAAKAAKYWQGDWVCKDCGYIYNKAECAGMYFEEQGPGFRCPQCSGPRRRYAKKVGDVVGTTLDGGDAPILIFSFGGVIATIIFGFWAVNNL